MTDYVNKVTLLILRYLTLCGYIILVLNQPPRPTQPGHPSIGALNEYWQWSCLGKNGEFCLTVSPVTKTV